MKKVVLIVVVFLGGTVYAQFDSLNMRFVGNWPFGPANAVAYDSARSLVFLGSGGGVFILDAADPADPVKLSESIHTRGMVEDLFYDASSQNIYIATGEAGLEIWDVSTPVSPVKLGCYDAPTETQAIYVSGPYAYITAEGYPSPDTVPHELRVIDISTPSNPREVGRCDIPGEGHDVCVSGSYAYVVGIFIGFYVIDVSTPSNPDKVCYYDSIEDFGGNVLVSGSYAYITAGGLRVIDISTPSNPQEVSYYQIPGVVRDVYVSGSYAYVVAGYSGLWVIDVSTPSNPQEVGYYSAPDIQSLPSDLYAQGPYVYVVCGEAGLQIYQNLLVPGVEEEPVTTPSPIRLTTTLNRMAYDVPGQTQLTLYSVDGRRVLEVAIEGKGIWDAPSALPQGVYFARVESKPGSAKAKVIVLR